ncbi:MULTISPECIES: porin [unclassified Ectothiorhodospira]|uniref:porin n=1 Tax=unclassified Ectothiorhodospira TaxID=2684909 RepID=UPI001EE942AD|nr:MULTISPECIES: porin [unclassified Ectothiorhodospira]MCG5516849.1 porin [Ectothiorhodospira sp. 9100]MCG5519911.1 porin [Ectothiorhodospira sp. 9905]
MKRSVFALAVAGAVALPAAALADATTLYGRMNVSLDAVDNGEDSSGQLASNSSRLGVRGSEDLGFAGLRGVFQIEAGLYSDNQTFGNSDLTARNTFLGLAGDFGELRLGKHDTPYKMATLPLNFFADTLGDINHVTSRMGGTAGPIDPTFYRRLDNTVVFMSPDFNGMKVMASYTTDRGDDRPSATNRTFDGIAQSDVDANDQSAGSVAATFSEGPMYVAVAYERLNRASFDPANGGTIEDAEAWKVGGTYKIQDLTLAAMYENIDSGTSTFGDRDAFHLGAKYQLGQAYLMGSYTAAGDSDVDDSAAQMFALGAGYDFSRRTGMYATYATVSNDDAADYGFVGSGKGKGVGVDVAGEDVSGFQVGVTHNF